jgi:pyruvate kinase
MHRRTRIVATLGPASEPAEVLDEMLQQGVDVIRINFSQGDPAERPRHIALVREAAKRNRKTVAVLADLPGPKLRVRMPSELKLKKGDELSFTWNPDDTTAITVTEPELLREVQPDQRLLLDDGRIQLKAVRQQGDRLLTRVTMGGTLLPNKGVNLPDTDVKVPALTDRDHEALKIAAASGVDWLALSFVRSPSAAKQLREAAGQLGCKAPILAKMERPEAIERAEEIIQAFDGIMVARGDLGVEIPLEKVPTAQKRLIVMARTAGKPVITATDMLDSMRGNPRPTRAEASDVANAIYDGTDAVMLSGETAVGSYPVEAVECMARIACESESQLLDDPRYRLMLEIGPVDDHFTQATCQLAHDVKADAIVTPTLSGRTARLIARHRPAAKIVAPATSETVRQQMKLIWGVQPVPLHDSLPTGSDRLDASVRSAFDYGAIEAGQLVMVLAGHPVEGGARFPTIRLVRVGEKGQSLEP